MQTTDDIKNNSPSSTLSPRDMEVQSRINVSSNNIKKDRISAINKKRLDDSYNNTLSIVRKEFGSSRVFLSKFIHNRFIESLFDLLGKTILRPNSLLFGSILSFIITVTAYALQTNLQYKLSGSETLLAFFIGWLVGIIFDYTKKLLSGNTTES